MDVEMWGTLHLILEVEIKQGKNEGPAPANDPILGRNTRPLIRGSSGKIRGNLKL